MTGLVRKAALMGVCGLLAAATAFANVPSPGNSDVPTFIPVVTTTGGVPYPGYSVAFTVRDFTNNPIAGSIVELDFTGCTDIQLCNAQTSPASINCGVFGKKIRATTNAAGQVTLTVVGGAINFANLTPGCGLDGVIIRADGVQLGLATAFAMDQQNDNAAPTLNSNDLTREGQDVSNYGLSGTYRGRADQVPTTTLNSDDLTALKILVSNASLSGTGATNCLAIPSTWCP